MPEAQQALQGVITRGIGGFYTVLLDSGEVCTCAARGRFRKLNQKPLPGDRVSVIPNQKGEDGSWLLGEILPRQNAFVRPAVANISRVVLVLAVQYPQPDLLLADRILVQAEQSGVQALVCLNKCDLADEQQAQAILNGYRPAYPVLAVSAKDGQGVEALKAYLSQPGLGCFAGPSGVGKSSLINLLCPQAQMEVGGLSQKVERGRHTTRHAELLAVGEGFLADTPGFSLLENKSEQPDMLMQRYPEMHPYLDQCRFAGCLHDQEPDCAVIEAAREGKIDRARLSRYRTLLHEWKEKWRNRYE